MKYSIQTGSIQDLRTPVLITSLKGAGRAAKAADAHAELTTALTDFTDKASNTQLVNLPKGAAISRILVVGGADGKCNQAQFHKMCASVAEGLRKLPVASATWDLLGTQVEGADTAWKLNASAQAISRAVYQFEHHKSRPAKAMTLNRIQFSTTSRANLTATLRAANALKQGLDFARDLGNEPPNVCNPTYLAAEARKLGRSDKVKVTVISENRLKEMGMGAFVSVSQGSDTPGKLIIVEYTGTRKSAAPYVLVGKGITFDTGGISLKPGAGMDEMKFDMCGAAAVLGTTRAVIEARLPINLVTLVAAAENMPSGGASRPGDIVKTLSGQTVEILNTDAEGRLVLCDALTYARRYKPAAIIDVATLTGAVIIALGSHATGLYANDDKLADALLSAGERTGDRAWRMPLWEEYAQQLKSNFADLANIGGREAGSVTAACFLKSFTEGMSWAHLDVAGSAFQGGARKGATGRPVSLLFEYLSNCAG